MPTPRFRRPHERGFTLVELLTVVVITGILATIGIMLVRRQVNTAKTSDMLAGIQGIRGAEESYRAANGRYLDCSGTTERWFPIQVPNGKTVSAWGVDHPDLARWSRLGVAHLKETEFGFLVNAGSPAAAMPALKANSKPELPTPTDYWYLIQAKGDRDDNGAFSYAAATSMSGEVWVEDDEE